jgi:hypothetical protein
MARRASESGSAMLRKVCGLPCLLLQPIQGQALIADVVTLTKFGYIFRSYSNDSMEEYTA